MKSFNRVSKSAQKVGSSDAESSDANKHRIKEDDGLPTWQLDKLRKIKVSEFKGKQYVNIREYYEKDGKLLPGKRGISLPPAQFQILAECIEDIKKSLK